MIGSKRERTTTIYSDGRIPVTVTESDLAIAEIYFDQHGEPSKAAAAIMADGGGGRDILAWIAMMFEVKRRREEY